MSDADLYEMERWIERIEVGRLRVDRNSRRGLRDRSSDPLSQAFRKMEVLISEVRRLRSLTEKTEG